MFSDHWYRVAQLKPMLQDHVSIERHTYRDEDWWVLVDPLTSRQHRLNHSARYTISLMDGERNLETIWDAAVAALRQEAPTQHEIIELLGQLHAADLLRTDATSDVEELFGRATTRKQRTRKQGMLNPLYLRVPLLDPDRFLNWLSPHFRFLFTNSAYAVAFGLVVLAAILLGTNFESVARSLDDAFLAPKNLALLGAVFVFMKFVHELSHGLAVKRWGGEVHDMGIVLLVLMPIPYVDASAANGFADKRKRMITSAAGIVAELVVASMAMLVWLAVEPGIVKQLAFDAMVVGTVSSLLFNGNPLLRFDGYYVLADAIEIPNLYTRAQRFLQFLLKRALLGSGNEPSPVATRSEALWLASFGVAAFCYRMFVLFVIAIYLSEVFLAVGVLLVVWALATQVVWPFAKGMNSLLASSKGIRQRIRVYGLSVIGVGTCYVALFVIPMPATTAAEGVVWLTDHGVVRAGSDCFVDRVLEISGSSVSRHTPLIECSDDNLNKERDVLRSKIRALQSEYRAYGLREQVKRKLLSEESP